MKKTHKTLTLSAETVRVLAGNGLAYVRGGAWTDVLTEKINCTQTGVNEGCAPQSSGCGGGGGGLTFDYPCTLVTFKR